MKKVLGLLAILIGFGVLGWIGYNFIVEMQPEARGRSVAGPVMFSIAAIGIGVKWLIGNRKIDK